MIQNINVEYLEKHPQNPRKDLGDLTELADSIRARGILQNLTVVPWFSSITGQPYDNGSMDGYYRVVIGHRRLAAAKLAGLTEVPCVVSDMGMQEQVATMLLENMQRSDLTLLEQAQGFQTMMEWGQSVEQVAEKTGFSPSTVRRRVKLLELDPEGFEKSLERGGTLQDYAELDQVEDPDQKNEVLQSIGTSNFAWALKTALGAQAADRRRAEIIAALDTFATEIVEEDGRRLECVNYFYVSAQETPERPEDAEERDYFYKVHSLYVQLLVLAEDDTAAEDEPDEESIERERKMEEQKQRRAQLSHMAAQAFQLRKDFVQQYAGLKKHGPILMEVAIYALITDRYFNESILEQLLGIELPDLDEQDWIVPIFEAFAKNPERVLLAVAYSSIEDGPGEGYWAWNGSHQENGALDQLYTLLEKLGYQMSDDEKAMQNGTHELFVESEESDGEETED